MEELNSRAGQHRISLVNREVCAINGVSDVLSFDVGEVLLETEQGMLMIRGSELHVSRLTLEKGEVDIDGRIDSLTYSEQTASAVTLVYDFLRIFRRVFPHGIFWISIEDLIYWCVVAGSFFSLLYLENNGTFRWFCVFGAAVGMLVVKSTASPFLVKAGARFGLWIKKVISYVAGWLMRPVKYTFRIGKNGFSKIFRGARRSARILKKRLTSRLKLAKIALCKQNRKALRGRKNG